MSERIGFVGVGRMGANMARRLKEVGYEIAAVHDVRFETAAEIAKELGTTAARTPADVAEKSDVVITVVSDDAAMRRIYAADGDSLLRHAKGKIFIDCATVSPAVHLEIEKLLDERGGSGLEACMASSIPQARDGTLYLMIGGRRETFEKARPMLEKMSASLAYVGKRGEAAKIKALVNMVMNINTAGLAEGLGLGDALGIDLTVLREVFSQTGANSRVLATDGADMQAREHECYFSAEHAAKDSGIALGLTKGAGLKLPLAEATYQQFERMKRKGLGQLDKSGVAELTFKNRHALD